MVINCNICHSCVNIVVFAIRVLFDREANAFLIATCNLQEENMEKKNLHYCCKPFQKLRWLDTAVSTSEMESVFRRSLDGL